MNELETQPDAMYKKIKAEVLAMIRNENLQPHSLLPSEGELAKRYGTSKMTGKMALQELEKEGVIYRRARSGSFVAESGRQKLNSEALPLQKNKGFVGLILPEIDYYTSEIISRLEQELQKDHYHLLLKVSNYQVQREEEALKELTELEEVKGVFLFPTARQFCGDTLVKLQLERYPIVMIDTIFRELSLDSVYHNHYQGAYDITRFLIEKGHQKIGFLAHNSDDSYSRQERHRGYMAAMVDHGLFVDKRFIEPLQSAVKRKAYDAYLQLNPDVTAVFCLEDYIAAQLLYALTDRGLRVPEDVSLVGFTDNRLLTFLPIGITTVRQPIKRFAAQAVKLLRDRLRHAERDAKTVVINTEIVSRGSVANKNITG